MINILDQLVTLDETIFLFFNGLHNGFWDNFMMLFTGKFIWVPMYAALLFLLLRTYKWKTALVVIVGVALVIALADQICAGAIRPAVERLRPSNLDNPLSALTHIVDNYRGGRYGFPSCHAANSFALIVYLGMIVGKRRLWWFLVGWAIVNSYSRLYLGVHYPGDLLVGAMIGSAVAMIVYGLTQFVTKYMAAPYPTLRSIALGSYRLSDSDVPIAVGTLTMLGIAAYSAAIQLGALG